MRWAGANAQPGAEPDGPTCGGAAGQLQRYAPSAASSRYSTWEIIMNIGILGVGHIGKTLARRLSASGHDVKVANSRGPETIEADVLADGARAVTTAQALEDIDVVILSIPLNRALFM